MRRISIVIASVVAFVSLVGCSKGPNNKDASNLAMNYLSGMVPGITEKDISILKTFEKEGNTIVVVQAGGMLCDMPVIKGKDGWLARGISCNGQFESPEKSAERSRNAFFAMVKKDCEERNKKTPYYSDDRSVRYDKIEFENNSMIYKATMVDIAANEMSEKDKKEENKAKIELLCSNDGSRSLLFNGITVVYDINDKNGSPLMKSIISKGDCRNL